MPVKAVLLRSVRYAGEKRAEAHPLLLRDLYEQRLKQPVVRFDLFQRTFFRGIPDFS